MSSLYEKEKYKARKEYLMQYYNAHRDEIAKRNHEKYMARKEEQKKEREDLKAMLCDQYCRYPCELDAAELEVKCEDCPLVRLK